MGFRRDSHRRNSQAWRPHFLQLIVHSTVHDGQLVIPVEFVQQLGEDLSDSAVLKVPNGKEWVVGLKKIDGVVWFHNGLQQFLEYHNISVGYFLVFRYEGDSQFLVLIFNRNACEIQYTLQESNLHDKHLILENEEREGDTSTSLRMTIIDGHEEQQTFQESNLHDKHLNLENEESGEEVDTPTSLNPENEERGEEVDTPTSLNLANEERGEEEDTPTSLNLENEKRGEKEDTPTSLRMTIIDGHEEQHTKRTSKTQGKRSSAYSGIPVSKHDCIAKKKRKRNEIVGKRTKPNASGEKVTKELENQQIAQRGGNTASLGRLEDEYEWASLRKERPVTKEERERAISASMLLKPKNPSFMVIMTPSYLRKGMNVPLKFSRNHFKDGLHHVKLRLPNGSTWPARFFLRSNVKALLSGGWNAFARENILLEGDCCVFEVFKKKNIEMKVSIFRVVEDWVPLVGSVTAKTRHPITFEESKATQAAREFKSKYPFYTVYMHRSYIRSRVMIMRQDFFKKHMPEEVETITLKDSDGRQWPVKLYSTNDGRAHRFGEGWSAFVKGKTIEEGDVCVFELVKKKDTVLKVSILKKH